MATSGADAAGQIGPLIDALLAAGAAVDVELWDGSAVRRSGAAGTISIRSPQALRHILWAPRELGLARAFVGGDLDFTGDVVDLLTQLRSSSPDQRALLRTAPALARAAVQLRLLSRRPALPEAEFRPERWRPHSMRADASAIAHHYDVSNEFYELVLGPSMTYSCAYFSDATADLTAAQTAKHELICRKLGLTPGMRLLDVGCGWGSLVIHAATHHGAEAVGITISRAQAELARKRVAEAGVSDLVEIRLQDYRELGDERFDLISSVGMSEHVGKRNLVTYFSRLRGALGPEGRLLNHAISSIGGSRLGRNSFMYRYVFPEGELIDLGDTVQSMQEAGFEVRDAQSLREHYAKTLRAWIANLESNWDAAVAEADVERARAWLLYMAASAVGFTDGGLNVHQVLGVVPDADGRSGMPAVRPA